MSKKIFVLSTPGADDDDELLACSENVESLKRFAQEHCQCDIQWSDDDGESDGVADHVIWRFRIRRVPVIDGEN